MTYAKSVCNRFYGVYWPFKHVNISMSEVFFYLAFAAYVESEPSGPQLGAVLAVLYTSPAELVATFGRAKTADCPDATARLYCI